MLLYWVSEWLEKQTSGLLQHRPVATSLSLQSLTLFSCLTGGEHLLSFSVQFLYMPLFYAKDHVMQGIQLIIV